MEFGFTAPVPPSWNKMYRVAKVNVRDRYGQPVIGDNLRRKQRMGLIKTDEAAAYQEAVALIVKVARPSGWTPPELIIVAYRFYLSRMTDIDNLEKALNDSIARALGVNDSTFWPVPLHRETKCKDPRVEVELWDGSKWEVMITNRRSFPSAKSVLRP